MSSITKAPQYVENVNRGYGEHWTDPDNVKVSDDTYATATAGQTDWLKMQDFDFATLPDTAKIMGIEVAVHCKGLHVKDDLVYLAYEGTNEGSSRAGCREWENNENTHYLGSPSDTWGWNLTPAILKSQWFGINFCVDAYDSIGGTASVDFVTLTVHYETKRTSVDVCNDALTLIGEPAITDIDGTDARSKLCKLNYGSVRRKLLGSYDWYCASYRVQLRSAYSCPAFGWTHVYELPANFLRIIKVTPEGPYELGAQYKLYMNASKGYLKYVADIDDPDLFDINFETAMAYKLALILHPSLVDKITAYQVLSKEANVEVIKAIHRGVAHQKHTKSAYDWTTEMRI